MKDGPSAFSTMRFFPQSEIRNLPSPARAALYHKFSTSLLRLPIFRATD
jgi:hypothetical protein